MLAARVSEDAMLARVRALVETGPRMGGTPSGRAASKLLAEQFEAAGLEVERIQDPEKWCHWEDRWSLVAHGVSAEPLRLERAWPFGFSPSARGRARLASKRGEGVAWLVERTVGRRLPGGPLLALTTDVTTPDGSWPSVRSLRAGAENPYPVFGLSRREGATLREALEEGKQVEVEFELVAHIERARPITIEAVLPAREGAPPGYLLFCAHGDSDAGGPGANDNASGEAIVVEIARAWSAAVEAGELPPPPREVRFAVWGSEIHSTRQYLRDREEDEHAILGVLNYDQCGFGSGRDQLNLEPDDLPANRAMVATLLSVLRDAGGEHGFPERYATNKSLGGTDSYVFSSSDLFEEQLRPSVTVFVSAWDSPEDHPKTAGQQGESWSDSDTVHVDYDNFYHSAGDTPENTTDTEPFNMGWCARVGLVGGLRWLEKLDES